MRQTPFACDARMKKRPLPAAHRTVAANAACPESPTAIGESEEVRRDLLHLAELPGYSVILFERGRNGSQFATVSEP